MSEFSTDEGEHQQEPKKLISYAQNFEDIVLWRALSDVGVGTYIDIGAAWPTADSVTALFYERGWTGVNVDPNPHMYDGLVQHRPLDINVRAAVADRAGAMEFSVVGATGLSTLDGSAAQRYAEAGHEVTTIETNVVTLRDVWRAHIADGRDVHFLKIDVEGAEEAVIRGADWETNRPWILVIEATAPLTQIETFASWEPLVTSAGYEFVYTDGLNRYYLAHEHADLAPAFRHPPNVFDAFITADHAQALAELDATRDDLARLQLEFDRVDALLGQRLSVKLFRLLPSPVRRVLKVAVRALRHPGRYLREVRRRVKGRIDARRYASRSRPTVVARLVRFAQRRRVCRGLVALLDRVTPAIADRIHRVAARQGSATLPDSARGYLRLFDETK